MTRSSSDRAPARRPPPEPPLVIEGWTLYVYPAFAERWRALREAVSRRREQDPEGYRNSEVAKFLQALRRVVLQEIPRDPSDERFQQGNTLGKAHRHWRRAKFLQRFRLFFRFHSKARIIVLVWLNDENSMRKAGSKTDPYQMFRDMLERGRPPENWDDLLASSDAWTQTAIAGDD
jgi:toxin YhaV